MTTTVESGVIPAGAVVAAMTFAGLPPETLQSGADPDTGFQCLYLEADIQQYSAFLAALAVQYQTATRLTFLFDQVKVQSDRRGNTRFWLPGVEVPGR